MYICPRRTCELGEGFDLSDVSDTQPMRRLIFDVADYTVYMYPMVPSYALPEDSDDNDPFDAP